MSPIDTLLAGLAVLGAVLLAAGAVWMRAIGADPDRARRLAGARSMAVADILDLTDAPSRPVRVSGRIRCADPLVTPEDERLVAFHRDVSVRLANGRWQTIERVRESRSFELWDHAGSLTIDPAETAEPLITIPLVWEGKPQELVDPHAAAIQRLAAQTGAAPTAARAVTRTISIVDPLLVLAQVRIGSNGAYLEPPNGGYLVSALELDAAMRLLGGSRHRQLVSAIGILLAGGALVVSALIALVLTWLLRA